MTRVLMACVVAGFCKVAFAGEGRMCVGDVSTERHLGDEGGETIEVNPGPREFQIIVDDREPVTALHTGSVSIEKLDLAKKHKVVIHKNGKPNATFRFRFAELKTDDVCLWYSSFYDTWSLWPMSDRKGKCDCPSLRGNDQPQVAVGQVQFAPPVQVTLGDVA